MLFKRSTRGAVVLHVLEDRRQYVLQEFTRGGGVSVAEFDFDQEEEKAIAAAIGSNLLRGGCP
jgi:hypothetical protein